MCGCFYVEQDSLTKTLLAAVLEARQKADAAGVCLKTGEVLPSEVAAAAANDRRLTPAVFPMRWGFVRAGGGLVINARSETASRSPFFRDSARSRRCLIPASCYFEWEKQPSGKQKYAIRLKNAAPMYLGGLYTLDPSERLARFAVLTRPPAACVAFIHDRMPVLIPAQRADRWLSPALGLDEALSEAAWDVEYRAV